MLCSTNGLIVMFLGLIAVGDDPPPARIVADSGSTHFLVSAENLVPKANLVMQPVYNWLSLGSGAPIVSMQSYKANVTCFVLPMSDQCDIVPGQD